MRAIWKGAISFGMVTIPVKLYTATEQKDVRMRLLHREDGAPIEEKRFCTADGREVAWDDLVRGYEVAKGEFVVLEPEEIEAAKPESSTFSLLKRALEETDRVALARVTIRTRERLATLRTYEDTLILETMFWPDEIRPTGALDLPEGAEAKVRPKELEMARSLVENLADRFRPESSADAYRTALEELIEQKMRGETKRAKQRKTEPKVIDLMDALRASVEKSKDDRKPAKRAARKPAKRAAKRSAA